MSSYVDFYLRVNDNFIPLGYYSRSTVIYHIVEWWMPHEKIKAITTSEILSFIDDLDEKIDSYEKMGEEDKERIKLVMDCANSSLQEKMEYIDSIKSSEDERKQYIEECITAKGVFSTYLDIIYTHSNHYVENDCDHYIYGGIEASGNMENVVE